MKSNLKLLKLSKKFCKNFKENYQKFRKKFSKIINRNFENNYRKFRRIRQKFRINLAKILKKISKNLKNI